MTKINYTYKILDSYRLLRLTDTALTFTEVGEDTDLWSLGAPTTAADVKKGDHSTQPLMKRG